MSTGDPQPTIETLLAHRAWVRTIARSLVSDESRVDDAEQETWLVAMDRPPSRVASVAAWLRSVVRSRVFDTHRSESRRAARERIGSRPETEPSTTELVAKAEIQRDVAAAVCALAEPYRTTILLRHFEELEPREIAARMGVPVETVRTRIKRGHERLRELLDEEFGDRRAWVLLVLPLSRPRSPVPVATAAGGALAMAGTAKLVAAAAAVLVLAAGAWWAIEAASGPEGDTARVPSDAASLVPAARTRIEPSPDAAAPSVEMGAALSVDVVDTSGKPVTGARIALAKVPAAPLVIDNFEEWLVAFEPVSATARAAQTSDAGRADIANVPPGSWQLRVSATAHADHSESLTVDAKPVARRIVLRDACTLAGTVTDWDGNPAAGAVVAIGDSRTTADAAGCYRFDALPAGVRDVRAGRAGVMQTAGSVSLPDVTRFDFRLCGGCELTGRVVDDVSGAPIAGALLRLFGNSLDELPTWRVYVTTASSGDDGRFVMSGLPPGSAQGMRVTHRDYAMNGYAMDIAALQMRLARGYPMDVEIRMKRGVAVSGRVAAETGEAVAGAKVDLLARASASSVEVSEPVLTDAQGRFRARAVPGKALIRVRAAGFVQPGFPDDEWSAVRNDAIPPSLAVTIDPVTPADVQVVLARRPAAAATGAIAGTVRREDGASTTDTLVELASVGSWTDESTAAAVSADGAFRFGSLAPGKYRLRASAQGCADARLDQLVVPATGALDGIDVVLAPELTITGRVVDESGKAVSSARIDVNAQGDDHDAAASAASGEDGSFVVRRLAAGLVVLTVRAPGFALVRRERVSAGTDGVEVRLERALTISGVVVDAATGEPVAGMPLQAQYETYRQGHVLYREVASDAAGRFMVPDLTPESFTLWVGRPYDASSVASYVPTSVKSVQAGSTDVRVEVSRGLSIDGRVVDAAGAPMGGGLIQAMGPKTSPAMPAPMVRGARIARDGTFLLTGLATGTYDLLATPRAADGSDSSPVRAADVQAGARDVVMRSSEGLPISGRLLLEDGSPLPQGPGWVRMQWKTPEGGVSWQDLGMIWSADGSFRTNALEPGRLYDLVVTDVPGRMGAAVRGVKPGTSGLIVVVKEGAKISGRIVDESGAPVPAGVHVGAHAKGSAPWPTEPGHTSFARTAADGTFTVTGLADGEYRLEAGGHPSDFIGSDMSKPLMPGATGVEIRVQRGVTIAGRLVDAKGVALKGGILEGRGEDVQEAVALDDQGRFAIHGLPPGAYRLSTRVGQRNVDLGDVQAPSDGLVLIVRDE